MSLVPEAPPATWERMAHLARAIMQYDAHLYRQNTPAAGRSLASDVALDAQAGRNLWKPAIFVLAAETIVRLQAQVEALQAELAAFEPADVWDPPPGSDRYTVYYEDERRPGDAVPLYRKVPVRVVGGAS